MKKRLVAIIITLISVFSAFAVTTNAYSYSKVCDYCGRTCYTIACAKKFARNQATSINCVLHSNCTITKREHYYVKANGANCGCYYYVKNGHMPNTHIEYATHKAIGRVYTCTEE